MQQAEELHFPDFALLLVAPLSSSSLISSTGGISQQAQFFHLPLAVLYSVPSSAFTSALELVGRRVFAGASLLVGLLVLARGSFDFIPASSARNLDGAFLLAVRGVGAGGIILVLTRKE